MLNICNIDVGALFSFGVFVQFIIVPQGKEIHVLGLFLYDFVN